MNSVCLRYELVISIKVKVEKYIVDVFDTLVEIYGIVIVRGQGYMAVNSPRTRAVYVAIYSWQRC